MPRQWPLQPVQPSKQGSYQGISLTEYGLISLLVLLVCLVGIVSLGTGLSKAFSGIVAQRTPPLPATRVAVNTTTSAQKSIPSLAGGTTILLKLSNGTQIEIPGYPGNLANTVDTIGANGTTTLLADTLQALAQKMLAADAITEAQFNSLMALSNQGHYIASVEKALEAAAQTSSSSEEFRDTPIRFDGKSYSSRDLRYLIGYENGSQDPAAVSDHLNDTSAYPATRAFQTLYQKALQSGALNDPAALAAVQSLSDQIAMLSDEATIAASKVIQDDLPPKNILETMAGDISHVKSTGICTTGNGKDSGVQCSN